MNIAELVASRELLWNLTLRELRSRYKRSALGWVWSTLNPLATMAIFTVVFSVILDLESPAGSPSGMNSYPLYLLCGLLPWTFFAAAIAGSMGNVIGNAGLVKKVYFAREVLVLSAVGSAIVTMAVEMGLLTIVFVIAGNWQVVLWLPILAVILLLLAVFASGIGLGLSALNVYFRDVSYLWTVVAQAWFYITPIIYPLSLVEKRPTLKLLVNLNPMAAFVSAIRDVMYDLRWPPLWRMGFLLGAAVCSALVGLALFQRLSPHFAEEL